MMMPATLSGWPSHTASTLAESGYSQGTLLTIFKSSNLPKKGKDELAIATSHGTKTTIYSAIAYE